VRDRRAAKSAIDDGRFGKRFGCLPEPDAGTADEQDGMIGERVLTIPLFEGGDFGGKWFGGATSRGGALGERYLVY
jgi:hypothetical protein